MVLRYRRWNVPADEDPSFLSYTRHELFRRLMCNLIGNWVENGQYPSDEKTLKKIVEGISYYNAQRYFHL